MFLLRLILTCVVLAAALPAQHEADDEKAKHPFMTDPARIEAGRKAYLGSCAGCHGPDGGGGRGPSLIERGAWHPMTDQNLFQTIQKGVGIMPAYNLPEDRAWELAAFVRSLTAPAFQVNAPGDPALGEQLFQSTGCTNCHRIQGKGGFAGPDLSIIGRTSTLPKLRRSILNPGYEVTPGFQSATLTLRGDGAKISGFIKDRTNYVVQLQLRDGSLRSIPVDRVEAIELVKSTTMPTDYKTRLAPADLANLISYLRLQGAQ